MESFIKIGKYFISLARFFRGREKIDCVIYKKMILRIVSHFLYVTFLMENFGKIGS